MPRILSNIAVFLITVFWPALRRRLERESLGLLSLSLSSGVPLPEAIETAQRSMPWMPLRTAMAALHEELARGTPLDEALDRRECRRLPSLVTTVLRSDLPDTDKGLLIGLRYAKSNLQESVPWRVLLYPVVELAFTLMSCLMMVVFVLPQFKEIFAGMRIPLPLVTRILLAVSDLAIAWWFLVLPAGMFAIALMLVTWESPTFQRMVRRLLGLDQRDLAGLFRVFAEIPPDRIDQLLHTISGPLALPDASRTVIGLRQALSSGHPVDAVLVGHGLDKTAAWMIRLAVEGKNTRENFLSAADLIEIRAEATVRRAVILLDVISPLLLSILCGFLAIAVFVPMVTLLESL